MPEELTIAVRVALILQLIHPRDDRDSEVHPTEFGPSHCARAIR